MGIYKHSTAPIKIDTEKMNVDKKFIKDGFQNNEVFTRAYIALQDLFGACEIDWAEYGHVLSCDELPYVAVKFNVPMPEGCGGPEFQLCIKVEKLSGNPNSYGYVIELTKNYCPIKLYYDGPKSILRMSDVTPDMMEDIVKTGIKKTWVKRFKDEIQEFEEGKQRRSQEAIQIQLIALEILPEVNAILREYGLDEAKQNKKETNFGSYRIIDSENSSLDIVLNTTAISLVTNGYLGSENEYEDLFVVLLSELEDFSGGNVEKEFPLKDVNKFYETIRKVCQTYTLLKPIAELWNARKRKI